MTATSVPRPGVPVCPSAASRTAGLAAGTALALQMGLSVTAAPPALADFDDAVEVAFAPFTDSGTPDWDALVSPDAWAQFLDPAHWDDVFGALGFAGSAGAEPDLGLNELFDQYVYTPLHSALQDWIESDTGKAVDDFINGLGLGYVIGNGDDGTAEHPDGGAGGWLFGDGGNGWDSTEAGTNGGEGGAAGFFGNGGDGGSGGAGAFGGDGGAGGIFGDGGDGGAAGDGNSADAAHPLPALGGAGGNAGQLFGFHGAVGQAGTLDGSPPAPGNSPLSVTGQWLTDDDGRVVVMHGLNEVYKIAPYEPSADGFSADDAEFLAANGFNAVRLGVIWAGVEPQPGVIDYAYLDSIKQTVDMLHAHGIMSILDMHQDLYAEEFGGEGAPDWAVQTGDLPNPDFGFPGNYLLNPAENHAWDAFWSNAKASDGVGLENHYARMWQAVAAYFKDVPGVGGYDVMNEPWQGSSWLFGVLGDPHFGQQTLTPFYDQLSAAIRSVDPNTPFLYEPTPLVGSLPVQTHLGEVDDPNAVYSFHNYCMLNTIIPASNFSCDWNADVVMGNAAAYADAHGIPALLTEFGATNNVPTIVDGMNAADAHRFGWLEWAYTGGDITSASPEDQALVINPHEPPTGDNVNVDKLTALAAPYPQAIAGTPEAWSFKDGVFQLSYSTDRVDGSGSFGTDSQTVISVPKIQYPDGYTAEVTGGHVISDPNATTLVISPDAGAGKVEVTVTAR